MILLFKFNEHSIYTEAIKIVFIKRLLRREAKLNLFTPSPTELKTVFKWGLFPFSSSGKLLDRERDGEIMENMLFYFLCKVDADVVKIRRDIKIET